MSTQGEAGTLPGTKLLLKLVPLEIISSPVPDVMFQLKTVKEKQREQTRAQHGLLP